MSEFNDQEFQEYISEANEFPKEENEFATHTGTEYAELPCEYYDCGDEFQSTAKTASSDAKKQTGKPNLFRKMSYLVTACVAVIVLGQSIDAPLPPEEDLGYSDEGNPPWQDEQETNTNNNIGFIEIDIIHKLKAEYDGWGYANGNVIPVQNNGLWGLIDYEGKVLVEPAYTEFLSSPNNDGYSLLADSDNIYLFDSDGKKCTSFPRSMCIGAAIGEDNIVAVSYDEGESGMARVTYVYPNGSIFYDTGLLTSGAYRVSATPFYESRAHFYVPSKEDSSVYETYSISTNGTVELVAKDDPTLLYGGDKACMPIGASSGFYFVAKLPWTDEVCLTQSEWDGSSALQSPNLKSFKTNGAYGYNYGEYVVLDPEGAEGEATKDYLFRFFDIASNGYTEDMSNCIAAYDTIYFDDYEHLAVRDGDKWFYIDYSGNVVSTTYYMATSFNSRGYAMIMEERGTAYIINQSFKKVHKVDIEDLVEVYYCDDVFEVKDAQGSEYLYYFS